MFRKVKVLTLSLILSGTSLLLTGQEKSDTISRPLNNFSLNLLGEASIISLNYERLFPLGKLFLLSAKLGVGTNADWCGIIHCEENYKAKHAITFPHHITLNFGKKKAFFEIGYGGTYLSWKYSPVYIPSAIFAFRLQPVESNKFSFRVFIQNPLIKSGNGLKFDKVLFIPVGFSFGVGF